MNCWCPTEGPHTVGPAGTSYFRHTSQTDHTNINKDAFSPLLLFYVTDQRRTTRLRHLWLGLIRERDQNTNKTTTGQKENEVNDMHKAQVDGGSANEGRAAKKKQRQYTVCKS